MKLTLAAVAAKLIEKHVDFTYDTQEGIIVNTTIFCPFQKAYDSIDETVRFTDCTGYDVENQKLITFFLY